MSSTFESVTNALKHCSFTEIIDWYESMGDSSPARPCLLNEAINRQREDIVEELIKRGALQHAYWHWPPLTMASERGNCKIIQMLLDAGVAVNEPSSNRKTAALQAATYGHDATLELLIKYGADVNIADENGSTPLMQAVRKKHHSTVQLLVDAGADKSIKEVFGRTAYDMARSRERPTWIITLLEP